ncbi:hypothetical protein [Kineococcus sp. SYSU DK005]|uniref:hypothetical protein n=1 Tax=Kineococcus sp. SYSU DK005 TaxID=3383126 RepID=UPI003D7DC7DF
MNDSPADAATSAAPATGDAGGAAAATGPAGDRPGHRWSRRRVVAGAAGAAVVLAAGVTGVALTRRRGHAPWGDPARAFPARAFTDSVGVNLHMSYLNTPYGDRGAVRDALRRARIRHVRDGWDADRDDVLEAYRDLVADGVRLDLIVGTPGPGGEFSSELRRQLEGLAEELPVGVRTLEGPNEYDLSDDPDWVQNLRAYHRALAELVDDGTAGRDYDLVAPSFVHGDSRAAVGPLPADFGNLHSYTGGDHPTESHLDRELDLASEVSGDARVMATETGYNTATANEDGQPGVPEDVAAVYVPRQFLENYRRGVARTFTYELVDEHPDPDLTVSESNYGLLRHDWSEKASFTALARMMELLDDAPGEHGTEDLPHTVETSAGSPLRRLLVQKSTGEHYLAVWLEAPVWAYDSGEAVAPETAQARLVLPEGFSARALHRLTGPARQEELSGREVTFTVTPEAQFIRVERD